MSLASQVPIATAPILAGYTLLPEWKPCICPPSLGETNRGITLGPSCPGSPYKWAPSTLGHVLVPGSWKMAPTGWASMAVLCTDFLVHFVPQWLL